MKKLIFQKAVAEERFVQIYVRLLGYLQGAIRIDQTEVIPETVVIIIVRV